MRKKVVVRTVAITSALMMSVTAGVLTSNLVFAVPAKPSGNSSNAGGSSSNKSTVSYKGAVTFSETTSEADGSYTSTTASENSILVSGGTVNLNNPTVVKSGDDNSGDNADFYGTNAAVLSYNSSKIKITGGTVTTNGSHANGVFAYGDSTIDISGTTINTTSNNSGGIMVTGGGTLNATNLDITTSGNSSAAIRSDRGGGTMTVDGGKYEVSGTGSPVIYSTANVTVSNATMISTASEGAVIEGKNSVTLNNDDITVTNVKLNGNSETYKAFFIYQSMSGDADEGTGNFTMKNSKITNNKGEIFFVTNTTALIDLEHNTYVNNDASGAFLKATSGKWGTSGKNGGNVTLYAKDDGIFGDIIIDGVSTLSANLTEKAYYMGAINSAKTAKEINITLDKTSTIVLTSDSYISSLVNEDTENSNIYANGYKLYVGGVEATINQGTPPEYAREEENSEKAEETTVETKEDKTWLYWLLGALGVAFVAGIIIVFIIMKKGKKEKRTFEEKQALSQVENNGMKKPWEQEQPLQKPTDKNA
ncbi:hypothetical protein IJF91_00680 [Candidatus Saccharibacteria bacterium]|nr:hypothetical protein [Candidatus Saccharibacteria bacterium]